MSEFLDVIETIRGTEASPARLFDDAGVRLRDRRHGPRYGESLAEAAELLQRVFDGDRYAAFQFSEALTTSDFPLLFGDVLDRMLLARYDEYPATYRNWVKTGTVPDFRPVKRFAVDGAEGQLEAVGEKAPYPAAALEEHADTFNVAKRGRRIHLSWETLVNDDLDAFRDLPDRLARAARRSEQRFATELYVDADGPHATLYDAAFNNIVTGNPVLSIAALQTAFTVLAAQRDEDGEPIFIDGVELIVPPALEVPARNILNAIQLEVTEAGGTTNQKVIATNWMADKVRLNVDPYIPIVANTANGNTSWFLFANPNSGRTALEMGFLRGHETPALFAKRSDADPIGGGGSAGVPEGDFDTDSHQWKVRHVFGGTRLLQTGGAKATVGSEGDGS